jgi:hypothetical protein
VFLSQRRIVLRVCHHDKHLLPLSRFRSSCLLKKKRAGEFGKRPPLVQQKPPCIAARNRHGFKGKGVQKIMGDDEKFFLLADELRHGLENLLREPGG